MSIPCGARKQFGLSRRDRATRWMAWGLAFLLGANGLKAAARSTERVPVTLQLLWTHGFQFAGYYTAIEEGYYRDAGFEVTLVEGGPDKDPIREVVEGRAQYGVSNADLMLARLNGAPVVIVAPVFQHSLSVLLTLERSGIGNLRQLAFRTLMVGAGHPGVEYRQMFLQEGINPADMRWIRHTGKLEDLIEGRTDAYDAYLSDEPYTLLLRGIPFRAFRPGDFGVNFYGDTLFTSEREPAGRAAAFREASLRGWNHALRHPGEVIERIVRKYAPDRPLAQLQYEAEVLQSAFAKDLVAIGHSNPDRWRSTASAFVRSGLSTADEETIERRLRGFFLDSSADADNLEPWLKYAAALAGVLFVLLVGGTLWNRSLNLRLAARTAELSVAQKQYQLLFDHSIAAVEICEMILDDAGRPVDFVVTHANPACDVHASLNREAVVGRRITEVHPEFEKSGLIDILGRVALTGEPRVFDCYLAPARRHFHVQAFQLDPGRCAAVFVDISEQRRLDACQQIEIKVSRALHEVRTIPDLLDRLPGLMDGLPGINGGGLYLWNPLERAFFLQAHWGLTGEFVAAVARVEADSENGRQSLAGERILRTRLRSAQSGQECTDSELGLRALVAFPLMNEKRIAGCLNFGSLESDEIPPSILASLEILARQIAAALFRLQTEELSRQSAQRFDRLSMQSGAVIWEADAQGLLTYASPNTAKVTGWNPEEAMGKASLFDFLPPDEPNVIQAAREALKSRKPFYNLESRLNTGDGRTLWMLHSGVPIFKDQGEPVGYQGVSLDITDQKQRETRRVLSDEILKLLDTELHAPSVLRGVLSLLKRRLDLDAAGIRLRSGEDFPYCVQQGFSEEFLRTENSLVARDALGAPCRQPDGTVPLECLCGRVLTGPTDSSLPGFTPGGSFWTNDVAATLKQIGADSAGLAPCVQCLRLGFHSLALVPIRSRSGSIGLLQAAVRARGGFQPDTILLLEEICSHIGETLLRRRAEETAEQREREFGTVLRTAMNGFLAIDSQARIVEANEAACRMLGYARDELLRLAVSDLDAVENPDETIRHLNRIFEKGSEIFETLHRTKDGRILNVEVAVSSLPGKRAFVFLRDITERKKLKREIVEIAEFERRRIGSDLHDSLGQQLTGIGYMTDALADKMSSGSDEPTTLSRNIALEIRKTIAMIRQIAMNLSPFHLPDEGLDLALDRMAGNMSSAMGVTIRSAEPTCRVPEDPDIVHHLYHIAAEAVTNAIRHGRARNITIRLEPAGRGERALIVEDDGCGFSRNHAELMGLGLRVMSYRAHQFGAEMRFEESEGGGARVLCQFPGTFPGEGGPGIPIPAGDET